MNRLLERLLVANLIDRYFLGDSLLYKDGFLVLHIQSQPPDDPDAAANWLPAPSGHFSLVIRVYGPDESVINGGRTLPPLAPSK